MVEIYLPPIKEPVPSKIPFSGQLREGLRGVFFRDGFKRTHPPASSLSDIEKLHYSLGTKFPLSSQERGPGREFFAQVQGI
jgi:hypothetical protein